MLVLQLSMGFCEVSVTLVGVCTDHCKLNEFSMSEGGRGIKHQY